MVKAFFITGTGTDIGKTYITSRLCQAKRLEGEAVNVLKPVVSGWKKDDSSNDVAQLLQACGCDYTDCTIDMVSKFRYAAPLSPDLAARKEGRVLRYDSVLEFCVSKLDAMDEEYCFVEGAGGVMSPIAEGKTNLDLMEALQLPVILVCGNYLGSISHTLTAISVIKQRSLTIREVFMNESQQSSLEIHENISILENFTDSPVFAVPYGSEMKEGW